MLWNLLFWGMVDLNYLIDREREEELRTDTRALTFANGKTHRIEAYRLVWNWFDRLIECEYTFDKDEIIAMIPRCAEHEKLDYHDALTRVVSVLVARLDREGIDITDDMLALTIAREQMAKSNARKAKRQ